MMRLETPAGLDVSVFEAVLACGQTDARKVLARQLAGLIADAETPALERDQVIPILLKLAVDEEPSVREVVAEELCTVPDLHADLIFSIVADEDCIALPFLKSCAGLSGWHMLAILRVGDDARQGVVARRADLTKEAKNHIVKAGSVSAVMGLLDNPAYTLTAAELQAIYMRLPQASNVVEKLLSLPQLPVDVRILQAKRTAVRMRQLMAEKGWLAANDAADLVTDAEEVAVLKVLNEAQAAERQVAVQFLASQAMLTPSLILRAACLGDLISVSAALAHLCGQPAQRIEDSLKQRGAVGLRSAVNRSGLPVSCHIIILASADVAAEFRNMGVSPSADTFGRRLLEVLMMQFGAAPLKDQAKQIDYVSRFAEQRVRKIARQLKADMLRAA
jgi:uncharacterized protein (DUF2336 family)